MVAVRTFVINIKNYMFKKFKNFNGGEISFGMEVLIFVVVIFVIWVLMGGAKKEQNGDLFLVPNQGEVIPTGTFGQ